MTTEPNNIKVSTTRFGELEIAESQVVHVIGGMIGFPGLFRYVLLAYNPPFSWLQCVDRPDLAFVVVNGGEFGEDYRFPFPTSDVELNLQDDDEIAVINLVSARPDPSMTTVNLKAPLVVNMSNMKARQVVLDDPRFPVRMPLWSDADEKGALTREKSGDK